ncbi:MAG: hypothetical protein C0P68_007075 [Bacillota bacterium]
MRLQHLTALGAEHQSFQVFGYRKGYVGLPKVPLRERWQPTLKAI